MLDLRHAVEQNGEGIAQPAMAVIRRGRGQDMILAQKGSDAAHGIRKAGQGLGVRIGKAHPQASVPEREGEKR